MKSIVHRAGWVLVDPQTVLPNAGVVVAGGRIQTVERHRRGAGVSDHGPGVIMPGLVNAHTHLGLSALKGLVVVGEGFIRWVESLMSCRDSLGDEELAAAACESAARMQAEGVVLAAEVGQLEPGATALRRAGIHGALFAESLGAAGGLETLPPDEEDLYFSFAGHGPHTTSPSKLGILKQAADARGRPFGLHLAESREEKEFLATGSGPWMELMRRKGHDPLQWAPWGERPVERAFRLGLLDGGTLAVHLLETNPEELDILGETGCHVCLCPRSNEILHGRLPDVDGMLKRGLRPALGTDSLASVASLSMFDEMGFMASSFPQVHPGDILAMGSLNGAEALGRGDLGTLRPGALPFLLYVDLEARLPIQVLEQLVDGTQKRVSWCLGPAGPGAAASGGSIGI